MASDMNNGWNFNRYNYAANNPYRFTDPDGRNAVTKVLKQTIKHKGDVIQAIFDVGGDLVSVFAPSSTPWDRIEGAVSLVSPVDFDDIKLAKRGLAMLGRVFRGRKGGIDTRAQNEAIGNTIRARGGDTNAGFGAREAQFGSGKGSRYSDGSATDANGRPFEVQTVDTRANSVMTQRETDAARDIAERSQGPVVCVSKKACGN